MIWKDTILLHENHYVVIPVSINTTLVSTALGCCKMLLWAERRSWNQIPIIKKTSKFKFKLWWNTSHLINPTADSLLHTGVFEDPFLWWKLTKHCWHCNLRKLLNPAVWLLWWWVLDLDARNQYLCRSRVQSWHTDMPSMNLITLHSINCCMLNFFMMLAQIHSL